MTRFQVVVAIIIAVAAMCGCSGSGPPTDPSLNSVTANHVESESGARALWGAWLIEIDRATLEASVEPMRTADLHINALVFIEPKSGSTIGIKNVTIDGTVLECDITLKHPFPGLNQYAGFDVRGILVSDGTLAGFQDADICLARPGETRLLNADGLTRWWDAREFPFNGTMFSYRDGKLGVPDSIGQYGATLNTYKAFADCLGPTDSPAKLVDPSLAPTEKRAVFSPGVANTRHYVIDFADSGSGGPKIVFNYAVDASWEPVQPPPQTLPDDFPMIANCPEAFLVETQETSNTLYHTATGESGGALGLDIRVHDWQGALGGSGDVSQEVGDVLVECPVCFSGPAYATVVPGSGAGETYSTWHVEVEGQPTSNDDQMILITIESSNGDWQPDFTGFTGTAPLAAFQTAWVSVGSEPPYNASLHLIVPDGGEAWTPGCPSIIEWESSGDPIDFVRLEYSTDGFAADINDIVASTPNDGEYEWDVPDIVSDTVRVRVSDVSHPEVFDISDADFGINSPGEAIWPTAKYDYQHLGVSPNDGPATNHVQWQANIGAQMTPGPTVGSDGTVYVGTNDGRFFAVSPQGGILWQLNLGSFVLGSASITEDGVIYVGSWGTPTGYLYAIHCGGDIDWQFNCGGNINKATPAVADDGTIYIGNNNGKLWALNPDGTEKWNFQLTGGGYTPSPAIGSDGSVYVVSTGGHAYGITDNGQGSYSVFWDHNFSGEHLGCPPTVDPDNPLSSNDVVYVTGLYYNSLWACDPVADTILWTGVMGGGCGETCATVGPDHRVYIGCNNGRVYAFAQGGAVLWSFPTGDQVAAGPILDPDGLLYAPSRDGYIYCLDTNNNGSLVWSFNTAGGMIRSEVAIAPDGTLYLSGHSGILRAFKDE